MKHNDSLEKIPWINRQKLKDIWDGVIGILVLLGIMTAVYWAIFWPHTNEYTANSKVNVFPSIGKKEMLDIETDEYGSKNYRLTAEVDVIEEYSGYLNIFGPRDTTYSIVNIQWPNGGHSRFDMCESDERIAYCTDQNDKNYKVEINTLPTKSST